MAEENRLTVLTVDDNEVLRYSLCRMLLDAGFRVIEAKTGKEALQLAAKLPDLITLDINLPDMDGFQVCRSLKTDPRTQHIPILHVSATYIDPEHRVRGLQGGADAYLAEPIDRLELVATVEALLRIKRSERDAIRQAERADTARQEVQQENAQLESRVRQRTAELEEKSEQIRRLNGHLMRIQDEERRKIARELHDSTGQFLAILNMNLSRLERFEDLNTENVRTLIAESAGITNELTSHLRTVSYLLHPPLLDEIGLTSALRWYVEGFSKRSNITVDLEIADDFGRLEQEREIAIFRVIQECLTNVHRHSGSQSAAVAVRRDAERVTLEVSDAGKKFAEGPATASLGTGILGMRERVRQLNGNIDVRFESTGTKVVINLPVSPDALAAPRES